MAKKSNVQRLRNQITRSRQKAKDAQRQLIGKGSMVVSGAATAKLESVVPPTVLNIPTKAWFAVGAYAGAYLAGKGFLGSLLEGFGDAQLAVYSYKVSQNALAGNATPWVAGDDDEVSYIEDTE